MSRPEAGLRARIAGLIAREGPLRIDRYMALCLADPEFGYYSTRPDLGEDGDFITAPLVSQMFGELLGLWAALVWMAMDRPGRLSLIEMGPGLGLMMCDVLRATKAAPGFCEALDVWLVETSGPLRDRQRTNLAGGPPVRWADDLSGTPQDAPVIILANELLDCLPIRQAVRVQGLWRERRVDADAGGALVFVAGERVTPPDAPAAAPDGAVYEWSDDVRTMGRSIGERIRRAGGAALFIDYGRDRPGLGDTLQAVRGHRKEGPLERPGEADLTAHVDFPAFLAAAGGAGAAVTPIRTQRDFLRTLGIEARAATLASSRPDRADMIARQLERLIAPDQMGELFKAAAVLSPSVAGAASGFGDAA